MLNTATPILQLKVTGVDLTTIQTMTITIKSQTSTIIKGNSDIEVDNDVVSVFLTQSEAAELKDGNFNVSVSAFNFDGDDISQSVRVIWTKRGSMSKPIKDYYTKEEVDAKIQQIWNYVQNM